MLYKLLISNVLFLIKLKTLVTLDLKTMKALPNWCGHSLVIGLTAMIMKILLYLSALEAYSGELDIPLMSSKLFIDSFLLFSLSSYLSFDIS